MVFTGSCINLSSLLICPKSFLCHTTFYCFKVSAGNLFSPCLQTRLLENMSPLNVQVYSHVQRSQLKFKVKAVVAIPSNFHNLDASCLQDLTDK